MRVSENNLVRIHYVDDRLHLVLEPSVLERVLKGKSSLITSLSVSFTCMPIAPWLVSNPPKNPMVPVHKRSPPRAVGRQAAIALTQQDRDGNHQVLGDDRASIERTREGIFELELIMNYRIYAYPCLDRCF